MVKKNSREIIKGLEESIRLIREYLEKKKLEKGEESRGSMPRMNQSIMEEVFKALGDPLFRLEKSKMHYPREFALLYK